MPESVSLPEYLAVEGRILERPVSEITDKENCVPKVFRILSGYLYIFKHTSIEIVFTHLRVVERPFEIYFNLVACK